MRKIRLLSGAVLVVAGLLLTLLPGSILVLLAGLMLLSVDWPPARRYLTHCQRGMTTSARRLDRYLLLRKLRK
ncbi:PGPGW domain-containing protein [Alteromonas halophila]|uniref:Tellurium resistance protein TerC n=1 Tax=Alteromonas halophila TaxID=516698 RepID=A0A918N0E4_9ALTE|nr:PGPGW domain-containing protein [Alteromonas halophila]GGW89160.1 hypothetical protein GCM10007391_24210 [Alteromonas halophila]